MGERSLRALVADAAAAAGVGAAWRVDGDADVVVAGVSADSHVVAPRDLFCCVRGQRVDGHRFAAAAVEAGAAALVVERRLPVAVPQVVVPDSRRATAWLAAAAAGWPSHELAVVGVTGTNGKTTTTHLVGAIAEAAGRQRCVVGTLGGRHTTPDATTLQPLLARCAAAGGDIVAMEVSSHALAQHRVDGVRFAVGCFTNLSPDHLDYHGDMEAYFAAKAQLFTDARSQRAVVNADDPWGRRLLDTVAVDADAVTMRDAVDLTVGPDGSAFRWRGHEVRLGIPGRFNVANALVAAAAARAIGIDDATIAAGLTAAPPVPGRFEPVVAGQPFAVVVDYAHTPDGLAKLLDAVREIAADGRVITVFGCGGDRDRTKRPLMGRVVAERSDLAVVTSDNPRSEDPEAIIAETVEGMIDGTVGVGALRVEPDRRAAISLAVAEAAPGDVVVIAGKGHEATQTTGDAVVPFDDRAVAAEELAALGFGAGTR